MDYRNIYHQIDSKYACNTAKVLSCIGNNGSDMGFKNAGSTGEKKAAEYIKNQMEKIGLTKVTKHSFKVDTWEFKSAKLIYCDKDGNEIICPLSAFAGTGASKDINKYIKIVYVGHGTYKECLDTDVNGAVAVIKVDLNNEYWLGVPAYQLERMGAIAVITIMEGSSYGNHPEVLNSANAASRPNIPILNISKKDGEKLLENINSKKFSAKLYTNILMSKGRSCNITGEIPGKCEEAILIGAHYDGYFNAYIDDAFGIGAVLNIARSILKSGIKPRYTLIFIAHGAEEFGVSGSHFDWCIGSWQQITKIKKDWIKKVKLFLNIDAVNPDATNFLVQAAPQLHLFLKRVLKEIEQDIKIVWKDGFEITDINGTWSDDFNYYIEGIPVVIAGRGESLWRKRFYHTDFDTSHDIYLELMTNICQIYCYIICRYDEYGDSLVDINQELECFERSIDHTFLREEGIDTGNMLMEISKLKYSTNYIRAKENNQKEENDISRFFAYINNNLIKDIRAIDFDDNVVFKITEREKNLKILNQILHSLDLNEILSACEAVEEFYGSSVIKDFDEEVYCYWYIDAVAGEKAPLQWGEGRFECPIDIRELYYMLAEVENSKIGFDDIYKEVMKLKEKEIKQAIFDVAKITKTIKILNQDIDKRFSVVN